MDCELCEAKTSVTSCAKCQMALCGECGIVCEDCAAVVCPDHVFKKTRAVARCVDCGEQHEKRLRRRRRRKARAEAREKAQEEAQDETAVDVEEAGSPPGEEAAVAYQAPPPWKMGLWNAGLGATATALLFLYPSFRRLPLPSDVSVPTPFVVVLLPLLAVVWSLIGILRRKHRNEQRRWCYVGLGVGLVSMALVVVAYWTDPLRLPPVD